MNIINAVENHERILDYATGQDLLKLAKEQQETIEEYRRAMVRQIKTISVIETKNHRYENVLEEFIETFAYNIIHPGGYNIYNRAVKLLKKER